VAADDASVLPQGLPTARLFSNRLLPRKPAPLAAEQLPQSARLWCVCNCIFSTPFASILNPFSFFCSQANAMTPAASSDSSDAESKRKRNQPQNEVLMVIKESNAKQDVLQARIADTQDVISNNLGRLVDTISSGTPNAQDQSLRNQLTTVNERADSLQRELATISTAMQAVQESQASEKQRAEGLQLDVVRVTSGMQAIQEAQTRERAAVAEVKNELSQFRGEVNDALQRILQNVENKKQ
jgi:chromosome segregation ATPase